ncbi:hypothetical protein [Micromonospora sp. WMMC273]|uniref:hypothetical protein n=1 Tax=Micromonospora sp. WMMC273 TaxID=3015157 RepID=UPI0022B70C93|nr:hypothetical protein [Micromonospora sp. WMMC273]MCZ7472776.1 hypothetical protein [Micromonospora sp. WMMC273]MCZ7478792.1 hypothetical protein [Micromonospora sp. WMMC273]
MSEAGKKKPSPLRGLLVVLVVLLIIPGTRHMVIDLAINVGWLILALVILVVVVAAMVKPR